MPADVYHKSAVRLDDGIAVELYDPLVQTHPVSESGHVTWQGRNWHVGDAFAGQAVVFEPREDDRIAGVRFANLLLGEIGGECRWGRLRPVELSKRRGSRRHQAKAGQTQRPKHAP